MPPCATEQQLKERYRELTRKHHPDIGGDTDFFCHVTEAGSVLLDAKRRKEYDSRIRLLLKPCPTCDGTGTIFIQLNFVQRTSRRCAKCKGAGYANQPD